MERRKEERTVVPELYQRYIAFRVRGDSGDFVDVELLNFSPIGIGIRSQNELPPGSVLECYVSVPKSLTREVYFKSRIKFCSYEEPLGGYLIGAEIIEIRDKIDFELFMKVHDFIKEKIGEIY